MNEQKTAVLVDTGGDIPGYLCEKYGIYRLALHVIYPEKDYQDGIDIDPLMVYDRFPQEIPKTSTPSPAEAIEALEKIRDDGYEKVIAVCISSSLSGTYNLVNVAAKSVSGLKVYTFDSKNISIGSGIYAIWAAKKLQEGWDFDRITAGMEEKIRDSHLAYYMDTLKYLEKGGRIGHVASFLGEKLHLKPLISCDKEGVYYTIAKCRGAKQGKRTLLDKISEPVINKPCWVVVGNGKAAEEATAFIEQVKERLPQAEILFEMQITASMAVHTGPGLLGFLAFENP